MDEFAFLGDEERAHWAAFIGTAFTKDEICELVMWKMRETRERLSLEAQWERS